MSQHICPLCKRYEFVPVKEIDGISGIAVVFEENFVTYEMRDHRGCHSVKAGAGALELLRYINDRRIFAPSI